MKAIPHFPPLGADAGLLDAELAADVDEGASEVEASGVGAGCCEAAAAAVEDALTTGAAEEELSAGCEGAGATTDGELVAAASEELGAAGADEGD